MNNLPQEHHWRLVDKVKRKYYVKFEIIRRLIKTFVLNNHVSMAYKTFVYVKLLKYTRFCILPNAKNRCILSGRSYGVMSYFKLSRFFLRLSIHKMQTHGIKRLSW
jgi:small subunit ribosomal protein S14